jgi:hypothetical protein
MEACAHQCSDLACRRPPRRPPIRTSVRCSSGPKPQLEWCVSIHFGVHER